MTPPLERPQPVICILLFAFVLVFSTGALAQPIPNSYVAHRIEKPITIDGKDTNGEWATINWSEKFTDIEGSTSPLYETKVKMTWDDDYFYFFAHLEEPHVWGYLKQRDTVIFYNNDFEIFIDPDGDTHEYYELEVNTLNTVWDLFLTKPYRNGGHAIDSWDIQGLQSAVNIHGSLNQPTDIDTAWFVEVAIPWRVITEASNHNGVPKNEYWRINFSRVNWDFDIANGRYSRKKNKENEYLKEYNWVWSPQWVINMHEPEHWGFVFFSDATADQVVFSPPMDEYLKYEMYKIYRLLLKNKKYVPKKEITLFENKIRLKYSEYEFGWNISTKSPFTNLTLIIHEDGRFETKQ